ncbi:MAG: tryptophan synthase subunit alpha [Salinivirgaceae bacterium]|jgi:tryptophan synthase alpha chain|nr:tryptophan synthase subunit alpha [Salinivirgaceae bacterium]
MNRINKLFQEKQNNILSIYFTAGHPTSESVVPIITELEKQGANLIEIGMPFSDPMADGPVIQQSSQVALANGMSLKKLIGDLSEIRQSVKIPLILMGYLNTVMQYGVEKFCKDIAEIGIDGVILPDMHLEVYEEEYQSIFEKYGILPVFLISPNTTEDRIRKTESLSKGFIYAVSSSSTTGAKVGFSDENEAYFKRIHDMNLSIPTLIGFGISNKTTFTQVCKYQSGGIIGSAFIKAVDGSEKPEEKIADFIKTII